MGSFKDKLFMRMAVAQALKGKGTTLPNPAVGAVLVKEGKVLSRAYHRGPGLPHAEALAIRRAGEKAKGAVLYVTLEPCNHHGRTPPCTELILKSGVSQVVFGVKDPNPLAGGGARRLEKAGVKVLHGVLKRECFELVEDFVVNTVKSRPFVSLKMAVTLDGMIADSHGNSKWITSKTSRAVVHRLRARHGAVMVGIGTVLADDPLLSARGVLQTVQPKAVVVDPKLRIPAGSKLLTLRAKELILVTSAKSATSSKAELLRAKGAEILGVPAEKGRLNLRTALKALMEQHRIYSILCEGGARLAWELLESELVDKMYIFYAPKVLGARGKHMFAGSFESLAEAVEFCTFSVQAVKPDILVKLYSKDLNSIYHNL